MIVPLEMMDLEGLRLWLELMLVMVLILLLFRDHLPQTSSTLFPPAILVILEFGYLNLDKVC